MGEALDKVKMAVAKEFLEVAFPEDLPPESPDVVHSWMNEAGWDTHVFRSDEDDGMIVSFREVQTGGRFFVHYGGYDATIITVLSEGPVEEM